MRQTLLTGMFVGVLLIQGCRDRNDTQTFRASPSPSPQTPVFNTTSEMTGINSTSTTVTSSTTSTTVQVNPNQVTGAPQDIR